MDFASLTDEALMRLYQDGEHQAFQQLYLRHSGRVYGYLSHKLHSPGEAQDLMQQTFLKFHQSRASYDGLLPLLPWLFSIARNTLIDHYRKHRAIAMETDQLIALADRDAQTIESDSAASWDEIMSLLTEEQRALIELRFQQGLSYDDIARLSGGNEASVRKRVNRTVHSLKNIFQLKKGDRR